MRKPTNLLLSVIFKYQGSCPGRLTKKTCPCLHVKFSFSKIFAWRLSTSFSNQTFRRRNCATGHFFFLILIISGAGAGVLVQLSVSRIISPQLLREKMAHLQSCTSWNTCPSFIIPNPFFPIIALVITLTINWYFRMDLTYLFVMRPISSRTPELVQPSPWSR